MTSVAVPADLFASLFGVGLLAAIAVVVLVLFGAPTAWAPPIALARAAAQLAIISIILTGIISDPGWVGATLIVMSVIATGVATRRIGWTRRGFFSVGAAIVTGTLLALTVVFTTGAIDLTPRYALAVGAITLGGSMSIATLTGRQLHRLTRDHWDEIEGWLALGASPRRATLDLARRAVGEALIPATDQTKTTGLVVLPGAFVGAIFGGIPPLEAGRFQLVVLAAILAAGATTSVLVATRLGPARTRPLPRGE